MKRLVCAVAAALHLTALVTLAMSPLAPFEISFASPATGTSLRGIVTPTIQLDGKPKPVAVYQRHLSVPRLGRTADKELIGELLSAGFHVVDLDYANHPNAVSPALNADSLALREAIAGKNAKLLGDLKVDSARVFVIAEGFRLTQNLPFATDGKRTLAMDIVYPADPAKPVPLLLEFSCDNANRMGAASLLFCRDTLLDGGMYAGFAVAMADHPVAPPYKGMDDPMPGVFNRSRDAVYAAWSFAQDHGLRRPIGVIGFSRGGPIAAMTAMNTLFRAHGENEDTDEKALMQPMVGAALVHGNRYDYLDLLPNDPMLPRFTKAWGDPTTRPSEWAVHGALHYAGEPKRIAPMFLNTSDAESPEYRDGLAKFHERLTKLGVEHVYQVDADDRGHRVTTDPKTLAAIYDFFHKHLTEEPAK